MCRENAIKSYILVLLQLKMQFFLKKQFSFLLYYFSKQFLHRTVSNEQYYDLKDGSYSIDAVLKKPLCKMHVPKVDCNNSISVFS